MATEGGCVVLTLDFEAGWGLLESGAWAAMERSGAFDSLRPQVVRLAGALDDREIGATWATVGAMALAPSAVELDHLPGEIASEVRSALVHARRTTFDGRDLIDSVRSTGTLQEFCCHSYTHTRFGRPGVTAEAVGAEVSLWQRAMPSCPIRPSLVFPQNDIAHLQAVRRAGIDLVRTRRSYAALGSVGVGRRIGDLLAAPPLARSEELVDGLSGQSDSVLINTGRRPWRLPLLRARLACGLHRASRRGGVLHAWMHPHDLVGDPALEEVLFEFLSDVATERDAGRIDVRYF